MEYTRACFDEQKTAYWILFDILVAGGVEEDIAPLPGNNVEGFPSGVWIKPSIGRLFFVSLIYK